MSRALPRLELLHGRVLCPTCAVESREANRPVDTLDVVNAMTGDLLRAADDGFPVAHIEPSRTQLIAAAEEREGRAEAEAHRANFLRRLAAGLTGVKTVGELFSAAQIERAWRDAHRDEQAA